MSLEKNMMLVSLIAGSFCTMSGCSGQNPKNKEHKKINIVYIMCDDHSYQTISAYDRRFVETPNIDRLAAEGARFTNSFVANSLSGPSRACLLTGKHSHKNGFTNNEHGIFDGSQQTLQGILQNNGYATAMIGKWHLVSEPTGFDYWDILTGQGSYYNPVFISNGDTLVRKGYATDLVTDVALDWLSNRDKDKPFCIFIHHKAPHRSWMPDIRDLDLDGDKEYPLPDTFYDDYESREAAKLQEMNILRDMNIIYDLKMADRENEIHTPDNQELEAGGRNLYRCDLESGQEIIQGRMDSEQQRAWDAYYDPIIAEFKKARLTGDALAEWKYQRYMNDYCRVIKSVDRNVGRVYDYLRENGLLDNTLVIYTSDQGFFMGEHGYFDKRYMYEESFRTPLIVRMPNGKAVRQKAYSRVYGPAFERTGNDIDGFVQNIDYAPTILDFAGLDIPEDMQGESFRPLLEGCDPERIETSEGVGWRKSLYYHYYEYPAEHSVRRHYGVRTERYSLMHFYNDIDEWELFDLKEDPAELHNIWGSPATKELADSLMNELRRLQRLYEDPIMKLNLDDDGR